MVIIILLFSIGALNSGMYLNEIKVQDNALNHPSDNKINVSLSLYPQILAAVSLSQSCTY